MLIFELTMIAHPSRRIFQLAANGEPLLKTLFHDYRG